MRQCSLIFYIKCVIDFEFVTYFISYFNFIFCAALLPAECVRAERVRRLSGLAVPIPIVLRRDEHQGRPRTYLGLRLRGRHRGWKNQVLLLWSQAVQRKAAVILATASYCYCGAKRWWLLEAFTTVKPVLPIGTTSLRKPTASKDGEGLVCSLLCVLLYNMRKDASAV